MDPLCILCGIYLGLGVSYLDSPPAPEPAVQAVEHLATEQRIT